MIMSMIIIWLCAVTFELIIYQMKILDISELIFLHNLLVDE